MKNRLLSAVFLLFFIPCLQAQVGGQLAVTLSPIPSCGCDGCFFANITNGTPPYVFQWSNGQTDVVTTSSATLCGFCPGQYSVTVTSGNTNQTATATGFLQYTQPNPVYIISLNTAPCNNDSITGGNQDCEQVCAGTTVTYTVSNSGTPPSSSNLLWQVSGASSWSVQQPQGRFLTVTWGNAGTGSISVISNSIQGCTSEDFLCVTILEPPAAAIGSSPAAASGNLQVCIGQQVDFQNLSTGDADNVEWFFSDDFSSSSAQNPTHTYLNPGIHTVTLVASSMCLCSDTTTFTVEVLDAVAPTLDCVATICPGETVTYTASNACPPFAWTVSPNGSILEGGTAGSDSITVQWGDGPVGLITLGGPACSGASCPIAGVVNIPIVSDNAEIRGKGRVCPGATEVYSIEPFGGAGFVWTLSGGGNITSGHGTNSVTIDWYSTPNAATTYWLSVKYNNCYLGCGGQDSIPVKILPSFVINGPVELCVDATGAFNSKFSNNNLPISCNWTMTGPAGSSVWSSPAATATASVPFNNGIGYYRLFATPANLNLTCTDQADWGVQTRPLPSKLTGIKGERKICPGTTYTYEAEGGTPTSNYSWTLKNGAAAPAVFQGKTMNVTWSTSGPRWLSVAHVSTDGLSCMSDTIQIQVAPIGIPDITGQPAVCEDEKGSYTIEALKNVDLQWQISPATAGSVASGQGTNAVEIFWSQPGGHTVNLSVCGQTAAFPVLVHAAPAPTVQAPAGLCPGNVAMVQTSTTFSSYVWKNDTGAQTSTAATPMFGPGTYGVTVSDVNGCVGTESFNIQEWETPNISLTTASPTGFCNNSIMVPLTALTNADGNYTFQWFMGGSLIPGQATTTYSTNQYGSYTVQATNANGCTSLAGPINLVEYCGGGGGGCLPCNGVACPPGTIDLAIDPTARCDSFQMHLIDVGGVYVPGTAQWIVGVSGGDQLGFSTETDPSFTFDNAGSYVAILVVQLTNGTVCNVYDFFDAEAVARINKMPECPGDVSNFVDESEFLPTGGISNWDWDFGDPASGANNNSIIRNAAHTYALSGNYSVQLTVTGNSGCTSSATVQVVIPVLPDVNFPVPAASCAGNAMEFVIPPNVVDITEITWDFGDPGTGASNDASGAPAYHNFNPAGNYLVTATATNIYGCTASFTQSIVVDPNNLAGTITPPSPPALCEGGSMTLTAPAGGVSYLWSDDNGSTTPVLTVSKEGSYRVTITDANGCTYAPPAVNVELNVAPDAIIKALLLNELNQVVGVSYPALTVCAGDDVVLQAFTNGSYNYSWSVSNGNNPILYFTEDRNNLLSVGTHTYKVTITNPATGCTAVSDPFTVIVNPKPSGFSISGNNHCAGSTNTITYTGPQPANWQLVWTNGQTGPILNTEAPGVYQIRVINEFGCEARSNKWEVLAGPPVSSIPAGCHTRCKPDTLCLPVLPSVTSWQWFLNGNPIPGATSSNFIAQQSGTYWAQLTDINGCTNESDPLTLNLYDGYGNILGQVWSDVNDNGVIDAADTLLAGIPVVLYQNGMLFDAANSGANGSFAFPNVLSTNYSVQIDPFSLPPNWNVVIGTDPVSLSGCDVEGNTDLLLHYSCSAFGTLQLASCAGSSVTYQGVSIAAGGTQSFHYTSAQGCDSTLVVNVVALQPSSGTANLNACPGSSATYAGVSIPVGATQNFTLTNWLGCDSIVTVSVLAWPTSTGTETLRACPGSSATYAGVSIPVGATQNFTLMNWLGCDSIVTVSVQAWPTSTGSATFLFACSGGSAMFHGISIPAGTTQQVTLQTWHGCDSIVSVTVAALPPATGVENLFACPGGVATYAGMAIPAGSSQNFNLTNWLGCDSIVTVNVAAYPTSSGSATLYACPGSSATYAGVSLPVGATQAFTLNNWLGCDSIVTVNVAAHPTSSGSATLYACPGSSVTYAGVSLPIGATQAFTLNNWLGCDSIVSVNVQAWPTSSSSFETGVCPGENFVYQGVALSGGTVQPFVLQNWLGCDSTVTVTVKQLQASSNLLQVSVCPGKTYTFNGVQIPAGDSRDFKLTNAEGCDSTLTVIVQEFPAATFAVQAERSCANAPTGSIEAMLGPGGQGPFQYSLDNTNYQPGATFNNLGAGTYTVYLEDGNGCVFEEAVLVPAIPPVVLQLPDAVLACDSDSVILVPVVSGGDPVTLKFEWWDGSTGNTAVAKDAGPVSVTVSDLCSTERSEAMVEWAELASDLSIVYVPNVLKPNSLDPENARFRPLFAAGINLLRFKFMVFDRWGNQLFQTESTSDAWDGIYDAQNMNPGVQVWYLEADVAMCGRVLRVVKKGDVTVVR